MAIPFYFTVMRRPLDLNAGDQVLTDNGAFLPVLSRNILPGDYSETDYVKIIFDGFDAEIIVHKNDLLKCRITAQPVTVRKTLTSRYSMNADAWALYSRTGKSA